MKPRVLVVDDSPFIRMIVKNVLAANGYDVVGEAADGRAAIEAFAKLRPDLVTLDLVMPIADGLVALQAIRASDPRAKVVMMTADGQASVAQEAMRCGASGYVVKPFKDRELLDALARATASGAAAPPGSPPAPARS